MDFPNNWPIDVAQAVHDALGGSSIAAARGALARINALDVSLRGPNFRVSIARTFTIETQLDALNLALATIPCIPELQIGDFGAIEQALFDGDSSLLNPRPDAVVVLWRIQDLHPDFVLNGGSWTVAQRQEAFEQLRDRVASLCQGYLRVSPAPLFLATLPAPEHSPLSDATTPFGVRDVTLRLNSFILQQAAQSERIFVVDFAAWAESIGAGAFDQKMDFFARQPISKTALGSFSRFLTRSLRPLFRAGAKVLALDLDNVLWGGILGEESIDEIRIGQDYPGNVYWRIQQRAAALKARGVLLALVSKNNLSDVEAAFEARTSMPLRFSDFSARRVNWSPKHENLIAIAEELNIGLDTIVFVDDSGYEREEVAFHLPTVHVLDVSSDPISILNAVERCELFDALRITDADLMRAGDYEAQAQRRPTDGVSDLASFLASLELRATIAPVSDASAARVVQMLGKTNQFNVTTRRHSDAEVRAFIARPDNIAFTISLGDKFGDQGIIGLSLVAVDAGARVATVDSFLLSCRAIGRGAEDALWASVITRLNEAGVQTLFAKYVPSEKNAQVADLFDRFGMTRTDDEDGSRSYRMALPAPATFPDWIAL